MGDAVIQKNWQELIRPEKLQVALNVSRGEGDEVDDGVKVGALKGLLASGEVMHIDGERLYAGGKLRLMLSPGDQCEIDAAFGRKFGAGRADDSRTAEEEDFHGKNL